MSVTYVQFRSDAEIRLFSTAFRLAGGQLRLLSTALILAQGLLKVLSTVFRLAHGQLNIFPPSSDWLKR